MASISDKPEKPSEAQENKIRVKMTSQNVQSLEKVSSDLIEAAHKIGIAIKGPARLPTKTLRITTRKTPCGEGSKTWDHFQMRIHKRVLNMLCPANMIKEITHIYISPDVNVEVTML
uniref:Small ribosomal subunit protein uS10 n=1 Tax=Acrobeloides nanus TaxID=290746 RepID=A0A914EAG2_9BILA